MISVTLQMDGNYPDISSGMVSFENVRTDIKIKRLKLEVDTGEEMDYILIGRDWQRGFDCINSNIQARWNISSKALPLSNQS